MIALLGALTAAGKAQVVKAIDALEVATDDRAALAALSSGFRVLAEESNEAIGRGQVRGALELAKMIRPYARVARGFLR